MHRLLLTASIVFTKYESPVNFNLSTSSGPHWTMLRTCENSLVGYFCQIFGEGCYRLAVFTQKKISFGRQHLVPPPAYCM